MKIRMKELAAKVGQYQGEGINHENQKFVGRLNLSPILGEKGYSLEFRAEGESGVVFHEERSIIGPSMSEGVGLWVVSTNHPAVIAHDLRREESIADGGRTLVFGINQPEDRGVFREEIALDLHLNGDVGYRYFWGLPGGEFKERSGARMSRA